jgi:membrane-associated phospholipid phosphatase
VSLPFLRSDRPAAQAVTRFDDAVDRAFDHLRGRPAVDRVMYAASELGDFGLIWVLLGSARSLRSERDEQEFLRLVVCLGAESLLVNQGVKRVFGRTRPVTTEARPHQLRQPLTSSFPSGHASSGMLAAALLSHGRRTWPLWYGLAALVATSRIHVRIHHASDVVAGAAVGAVLGIAAKRLWSRPGPRPR